MTPTAAFSAGRELPRYRCHKEVWAVKIAEIIPLARPTFTGRTCKGSFALGSACGHCERCAWERSVGTRLSATIVPADCDCRPIEVGAEFIEKHKPHAGGYLVIYADGYRSFSPAEAFESGYSLIQS